MIEPDYGEDVLGLDPREELSGGDKESVPSVGSSILPCDPRDRDASPSAHPLSEALFNEWANDDSAKVIHASSAHPSISEIVEKYRPQFADIAKHLVARWRVDKCLPFPEVWHPDFDALLTRACEEVIKNCPNCEDTEKRVKMDAMALAKERAGWQSKLQQAEADLAEAEKHGYQRGVRDCSGAEAMK